MRGIVFLGEQEVELRDFPDPQPAPREVVVAIKASGMCGSDLPPYRAPRDAFRNIIRGHEPCGDIASHGTAVSDEEAPIGRRVMVHHYSGCGECKYCRVGYSQLCLRGHLVYGANAHGGHADYILVRPHCSSRSPTPSATRKEPPSPAAPAPPTMPCAASPSPAATRWQSSVKAQSG